MFFGGYLLACLRLLLADISLLFIDLCVCRVQERQKGHHHRHKHHKHKKEKKEKDDKKEKRHKRKHQQDVAEEEAGGAKRQNTADGKPPAAPAKLKIKLVSKKPN
jgi:hypothetical protein